MKYTTLFITTITVGAFFYSQFNQITQEPHQVPLEVRSHFLRWKLNEKKVYATPSEENYRLSVFHKNLLHIKAHNSRKSRYTMAVNMFADLTEEEFKAKYVSSPIPESSEDEVLSSLRTEGLPASVDWTKKGAVTPVGNDNINSHICGVGWAFSSSGAVEGLKAIQGHGLTELSKQQLVDCTQSYGNHACQGGYAFLALKYIIDNGIQTAASYPYKGVEGTCQGQKSKSVYGITGVKKVEKYNNPQLLAALAQQPVTAIVDYSGLQFYHKGIIDSGCGQNIRHAVLLVGYGADGIPYWKVKNCWSKYWGEDGYFRVQRAIPDGTPSQCGTAVFTHYPTGGHV